MLGRPVLSTETRDRFRRHAVEIVALTTVGAMLGVVGVFPEGQPLWVVPSVLVVGAAAVTVLYSRLGGDRPRPQVIVRVLIQCGVLAAMAYSTGWGFALPLIHLFAIADNVKHSGGWTVPYVAASAAGWTLVAQVLLTVGLTPNIHHPVIDTWAIALFMVLTVTGVGMRVRVMAEQRDDADAARRASEERFRRIVEDSSDVMLVIRDGRIDYASPSLETVLGIDLEGETELSYLDRVHPDDRALVAEQVLALIEDPSQTGTISSRVAHADGHWVHVESRTRNLMDVPEVGGFVVNMRDVTDQRRLEQQLQHRAFHDALTELPNRTLFRDRTEQAIVRARRKGTTTAVLFIDLDGFKGVNDTLGHTAGDTVLAGVAERILTATREADTVARLGGDEFAVLVEDVEHPDVVGAVAVRVLEALAEPLPVLGSVVDVGASIGLAVWQEGWSAEELTRNADVAMYAAKASGKGTYETFEPQMHHRVVERLTLERELQAAITDGALELHYQPIVTLETEEIVGVEALSRWTHPERGPISPGVFIPIAEETGAIIELGRWALRTALHQAAEWRRLRDGAPIGVSVNVSARQFGAPDFVEQVAAAIRDTGVTPTTVTLELTESTLISDAARAVETMRALRSLGVRLAIDDFGTGYSSLSYLQRFPLDELKIDRSFVEGMVAGTQSPALVRAILDMSRSLQLTTVAEGIEHPEELARVRSLSCQLGQGYLFGRPQPAAQITDAIVSAATTRQPMADRTA